MIKWMVRIIIELFPVSIAFPLSSQYGAREEGVVYPGDIEVVTELTNGPTICSDVTATDTSCIVNLPRDVYNVTVIQTNDIGSTVDSNIFNS